MPLLRLQQPCACEHRPGRMARCAAGRPRARGAAAARPEADFDLLRRRYAVADGSGDGLRRSSMLPPITGRPPTTSRSHSRPTRIRSRRPASQISRQPGSTASRSACRASMTMLSRFLGRAHSARRRLCARSKPRRSNFNRVSFDLIYASSRRHGGELVRYSCAGTDARYAAPVAVPADDRAGDTICCDGRAAANSSRSTPIRRRRFTS